MGMVGSASSTDTIIQHGCVTSPGPPAKSLKMLLLLLPTYLCVRCGATSKSDHESNVVGQRSHTHFTYSSCVVLSRAMECAYMLCPPGTTYSPTETWVVVGPR